MILILKYDKILERGKLYLHPGNDATSCVLMYSSSSNMYFNHNRNIYTIDRWRCKLYEWLML